MANYLEDRRLRCCLEAAAETATLLDLLQALIGASDCGPLRMKTMAILVRAMRLCKLQNGLGDEAIGTEDMIAVLRLDGMRLSDDWSSSFANV